MLLVLAKQANEGRLKTSLLLVASLIISFSISFVSLKCVSSKLLVNICGEELLEDNRMPIEHWIYMGLNVQTWGTYNEEDVDYTKSFPGYENKKSVLRNDILKRIKEAKEYGIDTHMTEKVKYAIGDGTFSDGVWKGEYINKSHFAQQVQDLFFFGGKLWKDIVQKLCCSVYFIVLLSCLHSSFYAFGKQKEKIELLYILTTYIRLVLIGVVLFIILLECNLRYIYATVPLMILLSSYDFYKNLSVFKKKRKQFCE